MPDEQLQIERIHNKHMCKMGLSNPFLFQTSFERKGWGEQMSQPRGETEPQVATPESADQNKAINTARDPLSQHDQEGGGSRWVTDLGQGAPRKPGAVN